MYCTKCGAELADGARFCTNCGAQLAEEAAEVVETAAAAVEETAAKAEEIIAAPAAASVEAAEAPASNTTAILVLGIVAAAVSELGIPGIIVGAIGRKKAKAHLAETGSLTGKAKVGSILAKVGIILGIIMTVVWLIDIIVVAAAGAAGAFNSIG